MVRDTRNDPSRDTERAVVRRLLEGPRPAGSEYDACRAVLEHDPTSAEAFPALCMLLEGALADPALGIDDTQVVVRLLRALARGELAPRELA